MQCGLGLRHEQARSPHPAGLNRLDVRETSILLSAKLNYGSAKAAVEDI